MNYKKIIRSLFKVPIAEKLIRKHSIHKMYGKGFTKFIALHSEYPIPSIRNCSLDGINYSLDISNLVDWYIYFGFKEKEKEKLFSLLEKGQTVIDVGANIGDMTLKFAKSVGENGKVLSFEPFPAMFKKLTHNISLNTFQNIFPFNFGLANTASELGMEEPSAGNPGMNRITSITKNQTTKIKVNRLDDVLVEQKIESIDALKIDVEGFEFEVLLGASESIIKCKPLLFIELDDDNLKDQGRTAKELIQLLETYNYTITKAETDEAINSDYNFSNCHFDIICK